MVSSHLWTETDTRLSGIFSVGIERLFASLTGVVVGIYLQLSPLKGPFIFSRFISESKMSQLLSLQLFHLFKCTELTRQKLLEKVLRQLVMC